MQIPILNGITTDSGADFRSSYPRNLVPVPKDSGISKGYLHTAEGLIQFGDSGIDGLDRGAINWQGTCYRVIGGSLVSVGPNGEVISVGSVLDDGKRVTLVYSFDKLAISSAGNLYYYTPTDGLLPVTDPDLGVSLDVEWAGGYFITTDGASIVVTDLDDPFSVNPLKYGSSEASPDPINSLLVIKNQIVAVNRYTCEFFQNVGGANFPFQRIDSAIIIKGSVGKSASCYFMENFAFVGGGQKEAVSVYIAAEGQAQKIATREIETLLMSFSDSELSNLVMEYRPDRGHEFLYVHLPNVTAVYDLSGSQVAGEPIWFYLSSGADGDQPYRARNYVNCYGKWLCGDLQSSKVGFFASDEARQFGETVPWQFDTLMVYNEANGAIIHELELIRLPGRLSNSTVVESPTTPATVAYSFTQDGLSYGPEEFAALSRPGETQMRTIWFQAGYMENFLSMRFRGLNNPYPDAFVGLEARLEPLHG